MPVARRLAMPTTLEDAEALHPASRTPFATTAMKSPVVPAAPVAISLDERLQEVERSLIAWALAATAGNKSKAAALLKIKRSTLGDRINRCGIGAVSGSQGAA